MATETKTFEENLMTLEAIVQKLEKGDVPLEEAMAQFEQGVALSRQLQTTLATAEKSLNQVIDADGTPSPLNAEG